MELKRLPRRSLHSLLAMTHWIRCTKHPQRHPERSEPEESEVLEDSKANVAEGSRLDLHRTGNLEKLSLSIRYQEVSVSDLYDSSW